MTSQVLSRQHALFLTGGPGGRRQDRLRKTLIVSLILHVCVLGLIAGFRFKKSVERPLSAVQVSLVTAPTPEIKPEPRVEKAKPVSKSVQPAPIPVPPKPVQTPPPPVQAKPVPMQAKQAPAPSPAPAMAPPSVPVQTTPPQPAPALVQPVSPAPTLTVPQPIPQTVKPSPAAPIRSRKDVMEDLLKDIELPPNAPKFGDISPMKPAESRKPLPAKLERAQEKPQNDLDFLRKLKVPEMAAAPMEMPKESAKPVPAPPKLRSLSEELDPELKELKPIQAPPTVKLPEPVRETKPMFREPPVQQPPVQQSPPVSASVPKVSKTPLTKMNVPGSSGSNPYLALVQRAINEKWTAPPVDISGTALTVVIKFRLSRNGMISGVAITQQSGNDYYDLAGRRAVLSVDRLPPFPPDITEQSYDIFYTFAVGEGSG
jgi:colicin import membrane protein